MGAAGGSWRRPDPRAEPATTPSKRRCRRPGRGQHHLSGRSSAVATGALAASLHAALLLSHTQPAACEEAVAVETEGDLMTRMADRLHRHIDSFTAILEEEASQRSNDWLDYARDVELVLENLGVPMLGEESHLQPHFVEASPASSSTSILEHLELSHRRSMQPEPARKRIESLDSLDKATQDIGAAIASAMSETAPDGHIADVLAGIGGSTTKKPSADETFAKSEKKQTDDAKVFLPKSTASPANIHRRRKNNASAMAPSTAQLAAAKSAVAAALPPLNNRSAGPGADGKVASESSVHETTEEILQQ